MAYQFFNEANIPPTASAWINTSGFKLIFNKDLHLLSEYVTRNSATRDSHAGQYSKLKEKLLNCCTNDTAGEQKMAQFYTKQTQTRGTPLGVNIAEWTAGIGEKYLEEVFNNLATDKLGVRHNYDIVIVIRGNEVKVDNVAGFMIVELGECKSSGNENVPVLNLICTQSNAGEPIGRILLFMYVITLKQTGQPKGLLELASNYNNVGGLCLYNKFGFREDLSLKSSIVGKECFPDVTTLPMYIYMADPQLTEDNIINALIKNINIPVTFETSEPLCAKNQPYGPGGASQPQFIALRNQNQQNIFKTHQSSKNEQYMDINQLANKRNTIKQLGNQSKAGQQIVSGGRKNKLTQRKRPTRKATRKPTKKLTKSTLKRGKKISHKYNPRKR